jgi:hypothetical protein
MQSPLKKLRGSGAVVALLAGSLSLVGVFASTSIARASVLPASIDPGTPYIEICKVFTTPPINVTTPASFWFKVSLDGGNWTKNVSVTSGTCSDPIAVPSASADYTITEVWDTWYAVTAITAAIPPGTYLLSSSCVKGVCTPDKPVSAGWADVSVTKGSVSTVTFTNALVTGYTEICKSTTSGLTGNETFTLTGADGYTSTVTVPVGGCSDPIEVPAGPLCVTENGTNLYVTSITAYEDNDPKFNILLGSSLAAGTATVWVVPNTDASEVSVVNYVDDVVGLKVCKVWYGPQESNLSLQPQGLKTTYTFTETAKNAAGNGPSTAPASFSLKAGQCSFITNYAPGTVVTITEAPQPGTKVALISASGAESEVAAVAPAVNPDLANATVSIVIGAPTTGVPGNEADVTFVNTLADPSTLKICKDAAAGSGPFTFTVAGPQYVTGVTGEPDAIAPASFKVSVVGGSCSLLTAPLNDLPYNATELVTESATTGWAATAISSNFTNVSRWELGPMFVPTTEPVLSAIKLGSSGTTSSADVTMSEGPSETIVTWTNIDPPVVAAPAPVTVANPGGSNVGTTTAPDTVDAVSVAATLSQRVQRMADETLILKLRAEIKAANYKLSHKLSHKLHPAARAAELKWLRLLRAEVRHLLALMRKL